MSKINIINQLSIKNKTYLLVLLSAAVALILLFVSNNGLDAIRSEQKHLDFSSNIERYTNNLIHEEQQYRLNTNGSVYNLTAANKAYENALQYVDKIYQTLDKAHSINNKSLVIEHAKNTRIATDRYKKLYLKAVSILTELNNQAALLESEGELITLNIQAYVEAKRVEVKKKLSQKTIEKINNGSNIWQYTYVTRLHEKKYRLSPNQAVLKAFNHDYAFMSSEWRRLKKMSNQKFEFDKLREFNLASQKYKTAMLRWVELNHQLVTEVLPKMKELGNHIISKAIHSANQSVKQMANKSNNIALTLLLISIFTISLGIIIGAFIARSISLPLGKLKEQALDISHGKYEAKIEISSKDEIGQLADAFNDMSSAIADEMAQREKAEQAQRRSQKMDAVGKLTGGISHDFNNLLTIILGNTELLEEVVGSNPNALQHIKDIEKAGLRASTLTQQLLNFSRREATQITTHNINQSISEMSELIKRSVTPEIDVKYNLAQNLWLSEIDKGDFSDALLNLCNNARDSMASQGALTIKTENIEVDKEYSRLTPELVPGEYIHLTICDTGQGIPDKIKDRIFEPFFTTKDLGKGTGLGLAMVYAFVHRSKGYIKYESEVGEGTCFHIYLPRKKGEETIL